MTLLIVLLLLIAFPVLLVALCYLALLPFALLELCLRGLGGGKGAAYRERQKRTGG